MKVYYHGPKPKISVMRPIGTVQRTSALGVVEFLKGKPQELEEEEAKKLIQLDSNFSLSADSSSSSPLPEPKEPKKVTEQVKVPSSQEAKSPRKKRLHPPNALSSMSEVEAKLKGKPS